MPSSLRAAVTPVPPERLGWLILIPLACMVLGQALLAYHGVLPVLDGGLVDTDAYMRLNRVLHLYETGNWFDPSYPRINPPDGHVQHWTRALDALLLAGAWLLEPLLGFQAALHLWGILISPVCLALSILALNWATAPVLQRHARLIACLLLLLQPSVLAYSSLGRPDHHSLLLLLFILMIGLTGRFLLHEATRTTALAAGAVAALGLWISTEALIVLASTLAALGLYWLAGDRAMATHAREFTGWTTVLLALALLLERGFGWTGPVEIDRLSVVHVVPVGLIALFWSTIVALEQRTAATFLRRSFWAVSGGLVVAALILILCPELRGGPLGEVDPLYRKLRLQRIAEIQPLIAWHELAAGDFGVLARRLLRTIGIALPALPFLVLLLLDRADRHRRFWVGLALPLALFLPLAAYQIRWSSYAQILLIIPYSALIGLAIAWIAKMDLADSWRPVLRTLLVTVALLWPFVAAAELPKKQIETAHQVCPLTELGGVLAVLGDGAPGTVLALADYGPALLYRTPHNVLSIPNHRPQPGFTTTYRTLSATDERIARAHLVESSVDWILLCPSAAERRFFGTEASLYRRLVNGAPPSWLQPIDLPEHIREQALLYAVRPEPVPAPRSSDG